MKEFLNCKWLGLSLKSPFILSSLTLVSNVSLDAHVDFLSYICNCGAGAIVLPSINPTVLGSAEWNDTIADCLIFNTGLGKNDKEMGFSVLGPTTPNIISINYGISLAKKAKEKLNVPIIGSVVNLGHTEDMIYVVKKLCEVNVDALELNFSCPNVLTNGNGIQPLIDIIKRIKEHCQVPISLKLTPHDSLLNNINEFTNVLDGITLSNAYIGLIPPKLNQDNYSPFTRRTHWSPSGVYGPFEKLLTFYDLYKHKEKLNGSSLNIACVGGLVSSEDAVQALLLGADVVELSSAVLWHGGSIFSVCNQSLIQYITDNRFSNVDGIKGEALKNIHSSADELSLPLKRYMSINHDKCNCYECSCTNRLCLAISKKRGERPTIKKELCSGCGMCTFLCKGHAIEINYLNNI